MTRDELRRRLPRLVLTLVSVIALLLLRMAWLLGGTALWSTR